MISLVVAASENHVIGVHGDLPWRLPTDLQRFKSLTMGKPIVMGRLTWASIGRPLPGRRNIVLTRRDDYRADGAVVVPSPAAALHAAGDAAEVMVIGGAQIYELFLDKAQRIYLTRVHAELDGDAFFPDIDNGHWDLISAEHVKAGERDDHDMEFCVYERRDQRARPPVRFAREPEKPAAIADRF